MAASRAAKCDSTADLMKFWVFTVLLATLLGACTTLGPDFVAPRTDWDDGWTSATLAGLVAPPPGNAEAPWWEQFDDPALNALIAAASANNRSLKVAGLRVIEARAQLGIARSTLSPQQMEATAAAGYGASSRGGVPIGQADFGFGTAGVNAAWEVDFWGRFRRSIESADANYFANVANFEDFRLILQSEVARTYINYRTTEQQLQITRDNAVLQKRSVDIAQTRFRAGADDELDVLQARSQYLSTIAGIPSIEARLQQGRNALAVLLGRPPGDLPELLLGPRAIPRAPAMIPVAMPADVLRRRPDVRAAAFVAAAQSAQIGVAKADLYPSLLLVGSLGLTRTSLGGLSNSVDIGIGPALRWNFLDFGRIRGNVRVQDARLEQALEAYQESVLQAAREVDSAAIAFTKSREEDVILDESQQVARRSLDIAQKTYREGFSDFQRVLTAQAALLRQQERFLANRGQNATDLVAIHRAIGGGAIPSVEGDYGGADTRARMKARSNWSNQLDPVQESAKR
jgi:NodT family efflux transporter outer membrane factor (OMF) lipoprotein